MFYDENPQQELRFGDVLGGFMLSSCSSYTPCHFKTPLDFKVDLTYSKYVVVLTPCCTISNKSDNCLLVAPLAKINSSYYFLNSYFKEDLTRINRELTTEQGFGPENWAAKSVDEKAQAYQPGKEYHLRHAFIYKENDLFSGYEIKYRAEIASTNYYMIDFRKLFKVEYNKDSFDSIKVLELSCTTRDDLRHKIANYFGRLPDEDVLEI